MHATKHTIEHKILTESNLNKRFYQIVIEIFKTEQWTDLLAEDKWEKRERIDIKKEVHETNVIVEANESQQIFQTNCSSSK